MTVSRRSFLTGVAAVAIAPALPKASAETYSLAMPFGPPHAGRAFAADYTWESATPEQILADVHRMVDRMRHLKYEPQYLWCSQEAHDAIFGKNNGFSKDQPPLVAHRNCRCVSLLSVAETAE